MNNGVKTIIYKTLKNGLRLVIEEVPYVRSVSLGVWINVGSRLEKENDSGLAHFIEHMLFKGTKNRSSKKISQDIFYYGGDINAFTTHDHTCYHVKMPYNHIDRGIEVLSDIMLNSIFSKDEIEKEKAVIIEEIKMYEDSSEDYVYERLLNKIYENKGIGKNVLGSIETVNNINRDKIINFFNNFYVPNNSVIVVSGNVDTDLIIKKIEDAFKNWNRYDFSFNRQKEKFSPVTFIEDRDDEQANLAFIFQSPDDSVDKDYYSVKLIGNILGTSPSSRLFQHIREEKGLAYSVYSSDNYYTDHAEFGIYASVANENILEVYNLILEEIANISRDYISEDELVFSKEQYKGSVIMSAEDTSDRMLLIGEYEIDNKRVKTMEEIVEIVDSIDMDYIKDVIDRIFKSPMAVGITGSSAVSAMRSLDREVI
ncbi:M16 family metallopeptidase [Peptostreptococcus equinus]|uniref:Pitrilysin family protein n=1 Tax=Peptostreptococcus equinus TaxID=3003601 RepID=A0ABY7JRA2_9FIRM|nr:pitrilysin family protein [Peptostreptococcus sp. CBA3647]WAW15650.1 pitrilysin family protein [Peptostreptococcus sp. CBA3647]